MTLTNFRQRKRANNTSKGIPFAVVLIFMTVQMIGATSVLAFNADSVKWSLLKGQHFIVHLEPGDSGRVDPKSLYLGQQVLREAERHYYQIARSLGITQAQDPWLWDRRCSIYLYRSKDSYVRETHRPRWSSASASFGEVPMIQAHRETETFLTSELPHEIAHLLFRDYVGRDNINIPRWVDEGMALLFERADRDRDLGALVRDRAARGRLISVGDLDRAYKGGAIPGWASHESVSLFYAESWSLMRFLMRRYGHARFVDFLRGFKEGRTADGSLRKAYGGFVPDLESLEKEWYRSLQIATST